jgi:uncharacterized membrane protein YagU involved in acid resistance
MTSASGVMTSGAAQRSRWARWLIAGWLIAATCDISYATGFSYLYRKTPPSRILQSVASGLLGTDAYQGGAATAALGLGLHYLNALLITCIFFAIASQMPALVKRPILTGLVFGVGIYVVMNYVVIPLSRIGPRPTPPAPIWVSGLIVHMCFIGVPIVLAARRAFERRY